MNARAKAIFCEAAPDWIRLLEAPGSIDEFFDSIRADFMIRKDRASADDLPHLAQAARCFAELFKEAFEKDG